MSSNIEVKSPHDPGNIRNFVEYDGRVGELYKIFLLNLLLTIVTLGIYKFWAVSKMRRYLWSRCRFQGIRLTYTGTGGELFLGVLKVTGILILSIAVAGALAYGLQKIHPLLAIVPLVILYIVILLMALGAPFSAQRYRLSRTEWQGIRGGMTGSLFTYGFYALLYQILILLTVYQLAPWSMIRLAEYRINASMFGNERLSFHGRAGGLYLAFLGTFLLVAAAFIGVALLTWIGMSYAFSAPEWWPFGDSSKTLVGLFQELPHLPPDIRQSLQAMIALGIFAGLIVFSLLSSLISCWYAALFVRHVIGNTTYASLRFSSLITGPKLLWLIAGNLLIAVFTLGLGLPFIIQRNMRFTARNTMVRGHDLQTDLLMQNTSPLPRTGEGLLNVLDGGSGF